MQTASQPAPAAFQTKSGLPVPGVTYQTLLGLVWSLQQDYHLTSPQIVESASFSLAMVARFALGLSAEGGQIISLVDNSLWGSTALAGFRHLINAGGNGIVIVAEEPQGDLLQQLLILRKMEVPDVPLQEVLAGGIDRFLDNCHNVICGVDPVKLTPTMGSLCERFNEHSTPIHVVGCPYGVNPDSGVGSSDALYASSTLSLGVPLQGLAAGADFVGRHYVCDISFPPAINDSIQERLGTIFAEQPVTQIYPYGNVS